MNGDWQTTFALFGLAIAAALIASLVVPLVGAYLFVRRTSFHGIVLPQFAAAGIACGFVFLPRWGQWVGLAPERVQVLLEDTHEALNYHLSWAGTFTFGGLALLAFFGRRRGKPMRAQSEVGRLAAAFAIASAATELFAHASPVGEIFVHDLLRGEILFVGRHELETLAVGLGCVLILLFWFQRNLTLASFDPETARVQGLPVFALELLLHALTGVAIAVSVMTVGPVVLFGLLVLPPIAARPFARSMLGFLGLSSTFGLASALIGLWASFRFDEPLGPTLVIAASLLLVPAGLLTAFRRAPVR